MHQLPTVCCHDIPQLHNSGIRAWFNTPLVLNMFRNESTLTWKPPTPAVICHAHHHLGCHIPGSQSFTIIRLPKGPSFPIVLNDFFPARNKKMPSFKLYDPFLSQEAQKNSPCTLNLIQKQIFHLFTEGLVSWSSSNYAVGLIRGQTCLLLSICHLVPSFLS